jgi:hypothetical protein
MRQQERPDGELIIRHDKPAGMSEAGTVVTADGVAMREIAGGRLTEDARLSGGRG